MTIAALCKPSVEVPPAAAFTVSRQSSARLASLDVMRGMVILAMLVVNNIGDSSAVGYFWQHADWSAQPMLQGLRSWWPQLHTGGWRAILEIPLLRYCTLADLVMPMFMLIIGVAIPFSAAGAKQKGVVGVQYWIGVVRRGATIYALGWCIDLSLTFVGWMHNPDPSAKLSFVLGMNVLQLLGISFVIARLVYCMPTPLRLAVAASLFIGHWAMLRFVPQGSVPAGTFTEQHNASGYLYNTLPLFRSISILSWLKMNIVGMLSVPPAVATMTVGTWLGETLRSPTKTSSTKVRQLIVSGFFLTTLGLAWSFDLPMNKPRWTPCYLVYCCGLGTWMLAAVFWVIDVQQFKHWGWSFTVLGVNAIGIYFLSIMVKIWLLNLPRVSAPDGSLHTVINRLIQTLQQHAGATNGSWMFTILYVATVWFLAAVAYQKRLIWKV